MPYDGYYKVELWGAQGGNATYSGKGAYTSGAIYLDKNTNLYLYIGGNGYSYSGYNGGGTAVRYPSFYGGGATDIRYFKNHEPTSSELAWNSALGLNSRIMVAAGGSGASAFQDLNYNQLNVGAHAGGLTGYPGNYNHYNCSSHSRPIVSPAQGGSQTSGGAGAVCSGACLHGTSYSASFGVGAQDMTGDNYSAGGGGGGYYGGGGGVTTNCNITSSAGGSSFISGHTGCVAITEGSTSNPRAVKISGCATGTTDNECSIHYSGKKFTNTEMIDGSGYQWTNTKGSLKAMPNPSGGTYSSGIGHTGNGYAKVTYLGMSI